MKLLPAVSLSECVVSGCRRAASHYGAFTGQQVQRGVKIQRDAAKPASELMDHEAGRDTGRVDRTA